MSDNVYTIVGERIALGPLQRELIPRYHKWRNDLWIQRTYGNSLEPKLLEDQERWFDGLSDSGSIWFTIFELETGDAIGLTDLFNLERDHGLAWWGMMIGEADARGRGFASEVARLMLDYAFTTTEHEHAAHQAELAAHLKATGLTSVPDQVAIDSANRRLAVARKLAGTLPMLRRLETDALRTADDRDALAREIEAIGEVTYDQGAHESARQALKASESAAARIGQIDVMLATRPAREAEVTGLATEMARLTGERAEIADTRSALGFDPGALTTAREAERAALTAERVAREARTAADNAHAAAVRGRDAILTEQARIAKLIERAAQESRRAGELDTMYREFNAFEKFVADHLTPQLADYTGELLRAITEGKYDRVVFDGNFGIRVQDGDFETFPIEEFSGGERDVIALCARLALSRLIGGQANNPPGFMVLDEVFGSLDRERRVQVLEALGALAGTADAYHQLFIISHVDDVRSSPIFNEVWRVAEGPDGVSHLENLNVTGGFEDA